MREFAKKCVQYVLKWLAKIYLWRVKPQVIVVAGTTGRHWIKEAVKEVLEEKKFLVRTNRKNFNAEIGLPLSVLDLPSGEGNFWQWLNILGQAVKINFRVNPRTNPRLSASTYLVLEMAIDRPDNINYLLSIVKPHTVILTTLTMIYQENFENLDEIALEYKKLIKALPWNGLAILNFDDERVKNLAKFSRNRVITYGFNEGADFWVKKVKKVIDGQEFELRVNPRSYPRQSASIIKINRFGNHHIYAALVKEIIRENCKMSTLDFFSRISVKP